MKDYNVSFTRIWVEGVSYNVCAESESEARGIACLKDAKNAFDTDNLWLRENEIIVREIK